MLNRTRSPCSAVYCKLHCIVFLVCLFVCFVCLFCLFRYDVELYQRIEQLIGKKLPCYPTVEDEVMMLMERVTEAQRFAKMVSCLEETNVSMGREVGIKDFEQSGLWCQLKTLLARLQF